MVASKQGLEKREDAVAFVQKLLPSNIDESEVQKVEKWFFCPVEGHRNHVEPVDDNSWNQALAKVDAVYGTSHAVNQAT